MIKQVLTPVLVSAMLLTAACSSKKDKKQSEPAVASTASPTEVTQEGLNKVTENWPQPAKTAIESLTSKYGLPNAVTEKMVVWTEPGPFEQAIVYKDEVNHMFPMQHADILQQTVNYRVPLDKVAPLAKFDGSLLVDRTKGQLSARNEKEPMNILALNLAHQIVRGDITVEKARRMYKEQADAFSAGTTTPMLSDLNFSSQSNTGDPDTMMQSQQGSSSSSSTSMERIDSSEAKQAQESMEEDKHHEDGGDHEDHE